MLAGNFNFIFSRLFEGKGIKLTVSHKDFKPSVKVKFLSTVHPHQRDGLLKGNIEESDEGEFVFHMSPHQYYEKRLLKSINQEQINYKEEELEENYWENICLAKFWSKCEVVYGKVPQSNKNRKTNIIP